MAPPARLGCTTVVRRDTFLYVFGGAMADVAPSAVIADATVYRLNIATMQWRPLDDTGKNCGGGRFGHTLTLVGRDAMILLGGLRHGPSHKGSSSSSSSNKRWNPFSVRQQMFLDNVPGLELADDRSLWLLNIVDRTSETALEQAVWSALEEAPAAASSRPGGRMHHSATFVPALRSVVVFGGTRPGEALGDLWQLDLDNGMKWSKPATTGAPPSPRFGHTATVPLSPTERLDALSTTSSTTPQDEKDEGEEEDAQGRSSKEKTTIMIMGGFTTSPSGKVRLVDGYTTGTVLHLLDLKAMTWSQPQCFGSVPPPMGFHTASMTGGDTHLLVYGGETQMSLTLGHGGGAPFVFDRLRWVWSRPQFNSSDFCPPSLHATASVMNKPVTFGGVCRRNGGGVTMATASSAAAAAAQRPRVEVTDKLKLFNTVVFSASDESGRGGNGDNVGSNGISSKSGADRNTKIKLIIVGDSGVGKSNLLMRFADDHFETNSQSTIGVDFKTCVTAVGGRKVRLLCWDTAGQERYRTITSNYYRGADAALFVYDCTRPETVENLPKWIAAVREHCGENLPSLFVANKADMVAELEQQQESVAGDGGGASDGSTSTAAPTEEAIDAAVAIKETRRAALALAQRERVPLMETSARTSEGVDAVFLTIASRYLAHANSKESRRRGRGRGGRNGGDEGPAGASRRQVALSRQRRGGKRNKNGCC